MLLRAAVLAGLTGALAFGAAGCGGSSAGADLGATTLTVYSSLPLRGPQAAVSESIVNAEKLALEQSGGKAGPFVVKYVSLDDADGRNGWAPKTVSAAARQATQDQSTIGYLGDLDSGATAISIPTLNSAGTLQISPGATASGLTKPAGADKGEPEKYYPSGKRTFGRVIPADDIQAAAQVTYQLSEGCRLTYLLQDKEVDGKALTDQIVNQAARRGLMIAGTGKVDVTSSDQASTVTTVAAAAPDCVMYAGHDGPGVVPLFRGMHSALPSAKLFGSAGVADATLATSLPKAVAARVRLTSPSLPAKLLPPKGRAFLRDYRKRFDTAALPEAIYGYASMQVLLQAIRDAGKKGNDQQAVIDAFFAIRDRDSVLGRYSIDKHGDVSLTDYGAYRIRGGRLVFDQVIRRPAG